MRQKEINTMKKVTFETEGYFSLNDFPNEEWREVSIHKRTILVSSCGRIKSFLARTSTYKIMKTHDNGHGYRTISLWTRNKQNTLYVHRLVALAFIPNPTNERTVNHKDEDKSNNCVWNLEWCSYQYNNTYGTVRARQMKTFSDNGFLRGIDVYKKDGTFVKHYECAKDLERDGYNRRAAYNICNKISRTWKGFVFRFAGEPFERSGVDVGKKGQPRLIFKYSINDGHLVDAYPSIKCAERENGMKRNTLYTETRSFTTDALIKGFGYTDKINWDSAIYNPFLASHGKHTKGERKVAQYDRNGTFISYYASATDAMRETGVNNSHIGECCRGRVEMAGGFVWRYA